MASEVDICNFALRRVGAERINSLSDNNKRAKACNDAYTLARDSFISEHPWNFAIKRTQLAKLSTEPLYGFGNQFQLPTDCMRVLTTDFELYHEASSNVIPPGQNVNTNTYRVEGDLLLTDEDEVKIEYLSNDIDTASFSPKFVEALGYKLASELAYSLVQSNELANRLDDKFMKVFAMARLVDAQEGSPRQLFKAEWTTERL